MNMEEGHEKMQRFVCKHSYHWYTEPDYGKWLNVCQKRGYTVLGSFLT